MLFDLSKATDRGKFKEKCNWLFSNNKVVMLREKRKAKTYKQNKYLHVILTIGAIEFGYSLEEFKQGVFKREICKNFFEYEKNGRKFYKSVNDFDTLQMTNIIEKYRNEMSIKHGVYIPSPNETEILQSIEVQYSQYGYAQYL